MSWLRRLRNSLRPGRVEREIDREVAFHIAERADDLRAAGVGAAEAERRARVQFGNPTLQAERTRDAEVAGWADALVRNVRYGWRTLLHAPVFSLTIVLTLGLGIGANATVFSALDAVLLRDLPFPAAHQLVQVNQRQEQTAAETSIAPVRLADWDRLNSTFQAITGYYVEDVADTSGELPEKVRRALVAPRFLEVWGTAPVQGRGFTADEHRVGARPVVLISDRYRQRRFGRDADVLDRTVRVGRTSAAVVGVMPSSFRFPDRDVDLWYPLPVDAPYTQSRKATWYTGIGRLEPGVTPSQARGNLAAVQAQLAQQYPDTDRAIGIDVVPLKQTAISNAGSSLWLLFGAVMVLLLIACTNIAALLLSRGAQRQRELSIRLSLGASRRAIAAQLLTETFLLALGGGLLGLGLAVMGNEGLRRAAAGLPRIDETTVNGRIVLYTACITLAVALLSGMLPAIRAAFGVACTPGDAGRTQVSTRNSLQWLLVGAQVTLSVTLLAAAGLLVRSFHELSRVDPGFDPSRVLTFRVSASWGETADYRRLIARIDDAIDGLRALPGVQSVGTTGWALPGVPERWETAFELVEARTDDERGMVAEGRAVSPEYFSTVRIPVTLGEPCRRRTDVGPTSTSGHDVMVNQAFVGRYLGAWPTVVGLHLRAAASGPAVSRIVGVVGDARERGLDREPGPTVYWCFSAPNPTPYFLVRTHGDPLAVAPAIRVRMKELEPLRSVYELAPLSERIGDAFGENRLRALVVALFAGTALALACVGLYGTVSYVVSLRRRDVGLRLALGATRGRVVRQFLTQGLRVTMLACAAGLALSVAFARVMSGMLFGVSPSDPVTLSAVVGLVVGVTALAALVPSVRAAFVDPMQVLREE